MMDDDGRQCRTWRNDRKRSTDGRIIEPYAYQTIERDFRMSDQPDTSGLSGFRDPAQKGEKMERVYSADG